MKKKIKMSVTVVVMLMMICLLVVPMLKVKKADGADVFAEEVVIYGEALGKPISDKSAYTYIGRNTYEKVVKHELFFSCTEVDGKISSMKLTFNRLSTYASALAAALRPMADYANEYNNGVYFRYSEKCFVTRYKGNNTVAAEVVPDEDGYWTVSFTFKQLSKEGFSYIKYIEE